MYAFRMARFDLPLPDSRWPYWCASAVAVTGLPITSFIYFPELLRSGTLPSDSDTIAIPMFGSIIFAVILSPAIAGVTFLALKRDRHASSFLAWRRAQPLFSLMITFSYGALALYFGVSALESLTSQHSALDFIWAPYTAYLAVWLLLLRAAAVSPRQRLQVE